MSTSTGSAPGRLDLLGGVADYSGALVLETPTSLTTTVVAEPADAFVVGPATLTSDELAELRAVRTTRSAVPSRSTRTGRTT